MKKYHIFIENDEEVYTPLRFAGGISRQAEKWDAISSNESFDVCFTISLDQFRGEKRLNLEVKDIMENKK